MWDSAWHPEDQIIAEDESRDTIGNAWFTKTRIVAPRNWGSLTLVTADYHMQRALWVFRKVYGPECNVRPAALPTGEGVARRCNRGTLPRDGEGAHGQHS